MLAKLEMLTHFSCLLLETMQVTGKQATKNGTGEVILLLEDIMLFFKILTSLLSGSIFRSTTASQKTFWKYAT
jgi:hypothetical protein